MLTNLDTIAVMDNNPDFPHDDAQEQEYDPTATYTMGDASVEEEEYDPAGAYSPQVSNEAASVPQSIVYTPPVSQDSEVNGLHPQPIASSEVSAPTLSKRPRTVGGFVDESEDEEEESELQPQVASVALLKTSVSTESPQRSVTNTPNNTLPTTHVSLHRAQDLAAVSFSTSVTANESASSIVPTLSSGSVPVSDIKPDAPDNMTLTSAHQTTAPVPQPSTSSSSLPKARLPQDRVGILEDRITEDPRGDVEAWLSLIEEHRRRHKTDDARAVFERFLKIFPTAVSAVISLDRLR